MSGGGGGGWRSEAFGLGEEGLPTGGICTT